MTTIKSTFDVGAEHWTYDRNQDEADWHAKGGNSGGFISADAQHAFTYAPSEFLGDLEAFYGGKLSFDAFVKGSTSTSPFTVILFGDGRYLDAEPFSNLSSDWSHGTIKLKAGAWNDQDTQAPVTKAEMKAVLASLSEIIIYPNIEGNNALAGIDNFSIGTKAHGSHEVPPSHSGALVGTGPLTLDHAHLPIA